MKSTLTSADPCGWYEFACNSLGRQVAHWDGQYLRGGGCTFYKPNCTNFRRLFTESDVTALNEELQTLREELKNMTCKKQIAMDAVQSAGGSIAELKTSLSDLEKHKNGLLEHNHQLLQEVESLKQQLIDSESHKKRIIEIARRSKNRQSEQLASKTYDFDHLKQCYEKATAERDNLRALLAEKSKSQPYEMRRADSPDCEGLWRDSCNRNYDVYKSMLSMEWPAGTWYYLGPIPVVVEQKPPKVVTINYQGKSMRAIPSDNPEYWRLLGDNGITCGVAIGKFEEVQS